MSRATWSLALFLGLAALAAALAFVLREQPEAADAAPPPFTLPVTLCSVERGDLEPRVRLSGTVRAARRASLAFEVAGTIVEVAAEEAEAVEAGALLARLERTDEELELAAAEAALALALRQQELLVAGERDEEKRRLAAVLDSARAEEELAQSEVARGEKLLESRVLSESVQDRAVSLLRVAEKRRAAAEEELARALAGTRPEDLAIAAARVDEARTRVDAARHGLRKTELRSPWSGRVVERRVSAGDYVDSGAPVYELVDLEHLEIHVDVPGSLAGRLESRAGARVSLAGAEAFESEIDALVPAADEAARSFRAVLRLGAGDAGLALLRPGQFVGLEVRLAPVRDALLVPSDAILAGEEGARVVRVAAGPVGPDGRAARMAEFVPVRVLAEDAGRSALEARLAPGNLLVLTGADAAFPGVLLLERAPAPAGGAP
jgi:multidrug efflux pump subunit AcrA (membrane-fusion protein)